MMHRSRGFLVSLTAVLLAACAALGACSDDDDNGNDAREDASTPASSSVIDPPTQRAIRALAADMDEAVELSESEIERGWKSQDDLTVLLAHWESVADDAGFPASEFLLDRSAGARLSTGSGEVELLVAPHANADEQARLVRLRGKGFSSTWLEYFAPAEPDPQYTLVFVRGRKAVAVRYSELAVELLSEDDDGELGRQTSALQRPHTTCNDAVDKACDEVRPLYEAGSLRLCLLRSLPVVLRGTVRMCAPLTAGAGVCAALSGAVISAAVCGWFDPGEDGERGVFDILCRETLSCGAAELLDLEGCSCFQTDAQDCAGACNEVVSAGVCGAVDRIAARRTSPGYRMPLTNWICRNARFAGTRGPLGRSGEACKEALLNVCAAATGDAVGAVCQCACNALDDTATCSGCGDGRCADGEDVASCPADCAEGDPGGPDAGGAGNPDGGNAEPMRTTAGAIGDPHLRTFDGVAYDMQGVGELTLVESTSDELEVQIRTAPWGNSKVVAINRALAARVEADRVALYRDDTRLWINGTPTALAQGESELPGGGRVELAGDTYTLQWQDGTRTRWHFRGDFIDVEVHAVAARSSQLRGLLGNFDASAEQELVTRTGTALEASPAFYAFYDLYVESWRVAQQDSLFDYGSGEDTETFTDRTFPSSLATPDTVDAATRADAHQVCEDAGVVHATWLDACVVDVGLTGDTRFAQGLAGLAEPIVAIAVQPPPTTSEIGGFPAFAADPADRATFTVVQTIPTARALQVDPRTPIALFFSDEVDPETVDDIAVRVTTADGDRVLGRYAGELSEAGNTIMFFQPYRSLPPDTAITVALQQAEGLRDDGGNTLTTVFEFTFTTGSTTRAPGELGFEQGAEGWSLSGDAAIVGALGEIAPPEGTSMAALSTQSVFGGSANAATTSAMTSGPIIVPAGALQLHFDYEFVSEEFDSFVGQSFDDSFAVTIAGPSGATSVTLASVNGIGAVDSIPANVPGMTGADRCGWKTAMLDVAELGSPLTVNFTVSDVGDAAVTSAAFVDAMRFQ